MTARNWVPSRADTPRMQRGQVVEGYEIWGKLGEGGMSAVWLARHARLAIPVIVKTLLPGVGELASQRHQHLLSEARLMARVTSANVVRVLDVGVVESNRIQTPYLVEEYVDGIDLAELDARRRAALGRPLPIWAVARFIAETAQGLREAHQGGVVHCDVKPSNLFASPQGEVKVGDFGVATAIDGVAAGGTPFFMPPEQMRGERVDARSDVYALGATAFALRYGIPPSSTVTGTRRKGSELVMPPPRSPEEAAFQYLVARMLSPRPEARFDGMTQVRRELARLAASCTPELGLANVTTNELKLGGVRIRFEVDDISRVTADAIVNSANSALTMQLGVGKALCDRGGNVIQREARALGEQPLGECVRTGAGTLDARGILHAVGAWNEVSCISRATQRALLMAEEHGYRRIALPAIGTGQGGVSLEGCADGMVSALARHLSLGGSRLGDVCFVLTDERTRSRFVEVARSILFDGNDPNALDDASNAPSAIEEAESAPTMFAPGVPA